MKASDIIDPTGKKSSAEVRREKGRHAKAAPDPAANDPFLTPAQLSDLLLVSLRTVYRWQAKGTGPPYVKLSNMTTRYRLSEVNAWLEDHKIDRRPKHRRGAH